MLRKKALTSAIPADAFDAEEDDENAELQAALKDLELLESGDPFSGEVEGSEELRSQISKEISEVSADRNTAATIKAATAKAKAKVKGKAKPNPSTDVVPEESFTPTETALRRATDYLRTIHQGAVLTEDELEEEALLLLVRNFSGDTVDGSVKKILDDTAHKKNFLIDIAGDLAKINNYDSESELDDSDTDDDFANDPGPEFLKPFPIHSETVEVPIPATPADGDLQAAATTATSGPAANTVQIRKLKESFKKYEASVVEFLHAAQDVQNRNQLGCENNGEISFLHRITDSGAHELFAVSWTDHINKMGRPVRIDTKNRVVYSPAVLFGKAVPAESFATCNVIINRAGASNKRFAGSLRDQLPDTVVRFLLTCKLLISINQEVRLCY